MRAVALIVPCLLASTVLALSGPSAVAAGSSCTRPAGVQPIGFSATRFPGIRRHYERARA